jgi:hypothetical protein
METRGRYDLLPGHLQIKPRCQLAPRKIVGAEEIMMRAAAAAEGLGGVGQGAMMEDKILKGEITAVAGVHVQHG